MARSKQRGSMKELLAKLNRDPKFRAAMAKLKASDGKRRVNSVKDLFQLITGVVTRFVSTRKAKMIEEMVELAVLFIEISVIMKENIFDRPEVNEFFKTRLSSVRTHAESINRVARHYVDNTINRFRPKGKSASAATAASVA